MSTPQPIDDEQTKLWNGPAGRAWVETQDLLDRTLQPFEDLLVEALPLRSALRVLDVGCGTGSTTLAFARRLGAASRCVGIDISEPMIAAARTAAAWDGSSASFVCADAQTHAFDPASFDTIVSRFGVMFFNDAVRAFANLRRAATDGAELRFFAWRGADENPFMTTAERTAAPLLPSLPPRRPDAPGQFAFADRQRVHAMLEESGWADIEIQPIDVPCSFPASELVRYFSRLGPVGMVLQDADEATRTQIIDAVRPAFAPYVHGADVRFTAACWLVTAGTH